MTYPVWPELLEPVEVRFGRGSDQTPSKKDGNVDGPSKFSCDFTDARRAWLGVPAYIEESQHDNGASSFATITALTVTIPCHLESRTLLWHVSTRRRPDACLALERNWSQPIVHKQT